MCKWLKKVGATVGCPHHGQVHVGFFTSSAKHRCMTKISDPSVVQLGSNLWSKNDSFGLKPRLKAMVISTAPQRRLLICIRRKRDTESIFYRWSSLVKTIAVTSSTFFLQAKDMISIVVNNSAHPKLTVTILVIFQTCYNTMNTTCFKVTFYTDPFDIACI